MVRSVLREEVQKKHILNGALKYVKDLVSDFRSEERRRVSYVCMI